MWKRGGRPASGSDIQEPCDDNAYRRLRRRVVIVEQQALAAGCRSSRDRFSIPLEEWSLSFSLRRAASKRRGEPGRKGASLSRVGQPGVGAST
jgi:hypothetical protein